MDYVKVNLVLPEPEWDALAKSAWENLRQPKAQARYLIRFALGLEPPGASRTNSEGAGLCVPGQFKGDFAGGGREVEATMESAADIYGELLPTERTAIVVGRILLGERLTTRQIADYLGITWDGAHKMLGKIARVLPIVQTDGCWERGPIAWPY